MTTRYVSIGETGDLEDVSPLKPFRAIIIAERLLTPERQWEVSQWLVRSGCFYALAWGVECSSWDDSIDYANIEHVLPAEITEDNSLMTTWHENEPIEGVFRFAKKHARFEDDESTSTLLVHLGDISRRDELIAAFARA